MYLGLDIGTSSIKAVLVDPEQNVVGSAEAEIEVMRPHPGWSEQDPVSWWSAVVSTIDSLHAQYAKEISQVRAIGLSGQMHGATLLDTNNQPLRPCILWNDGRSQSQCEALEKSSPTSRGVTGNIAMPGFTAPKLLWIKEHEPAIFDKIHKVVLPKDYVRFQLTGEYFSDCSDASGTLWLDTGQRCWSKPLLEATSLSIEQMPELVEGTSPAGQLNKALRQRWGMRHTVVVAGGAGDNAASACGIGAINPGDAFISLGTSGVLFASNAGFMPNTDSAVHAFCHAVPAAWHQMGVTLSAASCFDWLAHCTSSDVASVYNDLQHPLETDSELFFLPYLSGERTPHNDASARGAFVGLNHDSRRHHLSHAVAHGVAFAFKDCLAALNDAGTVIDRLVAVGGGSRASAWLQVLANVLDVSIAVPVNKEIGAALGAARLAIVADTNAHPTQIMTPVETTEEFQPEQSQTKLFNHQWSRYRALYPAIKEALLT